VAAADLVSEVVPLKHHFVDKGIKAQRGIEF
jgi:ATP:corrinoid adenosyltransferase